MGVTGTLKSVSAVQREIIVNDFNIHEETYIPSVFGDNKLEFNPVTNVHVVDRSSFFQQIIDQINENLIGEGVGQRAVIVIFEDEKILKELYNSPLYDQLKNSTDYLTEAANVKEANDAVLKATKMGRITLLTRGYGRGTDFVILDERVRANGGMCTIQTFIPESESELIQIKGRSAR